MIFFNLLIIFCFIEFTIIILVKWFKKDFNWIIEKEDTYPSFDDFLIKKYNKEIFHSLLGWDNTKRKKNDYLKSKKKIEYNFDSKNSRITSNKYSKEEIAIFGDSYAMSRYCNDNETIQFFLEKIKKVKILNYGVGNYGLDQTLIKIKTKKLKKIKKVIIIFVPETISRIQSYWKHFLEFGNILAFKPKYDLKNDKLILKKNHINLIKKDKIKKVIIRLQKKDYFFKNKFQKYLFKFPYSISFLRNFNDNIVIFNQLIFFKILKKNFFYKKAYTQVMKRNIIEAQNFYLDKSFTNLLSKIILDTKKTLAQKGIKTFFFIIPQLLDIKLYKNKSFSKIFFQNLSSKYKLNLYDLSDDLFKIKKIEDIFVEDHYGGHLNKKGNRKVSKLISKILSNK